MIGKFHNWISISRRMVAVALVVGLALAGARTHAHAAIVTFTGVDLTAAKVSYSGNPADPLVGANILVNLVLSSSTLGGPPLVILNGRLDFETGPNVVEGGTPPNVFWTFGTGGFLTVTGDTTEASGILFSGAFGDDPALPRVDINTGLTTASMLAYGTGSLHPDLAEYFAVLANGDATFQLELDGLQDQFSAITRSFTMVPGDVTLQVNTGSIPEPGTMACWSVLLIGVGFVAARRRRRS